MPVRKHLRRLRHFVWSGCDKTNPAVHPQQREEHEQGPYKPVLFKSRGDLQRPARVPREAGHVHPGHNERRTIHDTVNPFEDPGSDDEFGDDHSPTKNVPLQPLEPLQVPPSSPFQPRFSAVFRQAVEQQPKQQPRTSLAPSTRTSRTSYAGSLTPSVLSQRHALVADAKPMPILGSANPRLWKGNPEGSAPTIAKPMHVHRKPRLDKSLLPPPASSSDHYGSIAGVLRRS